MTAEERTGWRDQELSNRHRTWGHDCPAEDVDFLLDTQPTMFNDSFRLVEYYHARPKALIEYKHWNDSTYATVMKDLGLAANGTMHANYRVHQDLCDNYVCPPVNGLPYMVVFYRYRPWQFKVVPINTASKRVFRNHPEFDGTSLPASEVRFVRLLYHLRDGIEVPAHVISRLDDQHPVPTSEKVHV